MKIEIKYSESENSPSLNLFSSPLQVLQHVSRINDFKSSSHGEKITAKNKAIMWLHVFGWRNRKIKRSKRREKRFFIICWNMIILFHAIRKKHNKCEIEHKRDGVYI